MKNHLRVCPHCRPALRNPSSGIMHQGFNFCLGGDGGSSAHFGAAKGGGCTCVSQGAQKVLSTGYSQGECAVENVTGPRCIDGIHSKGLDASAFLFRPR